MGRAPRGLTLQQRSAFLVLIALGVAGWALTVSLLLALERKKIISRRQGIAVVAEAADAVRALVDLGDHPALQLAIKIIEGEVHEWKDPTE